MEEEGGLESALVWFGLVCLELGGEVGSCGSSFSLFSPFRAGLYILRPVGGGIWAIQVIVHLWGFLVRLLTVRVRSQKDQTN